MVSHCGCVEGAAGGTPPTTLQQRPRVLGLQPSCPQGIRPPGGCRPGGVHVSTPCGTLQPGDVGRINPELTGQRPQLPEATGSHDCLNKGP